MFGSGRGAPGGGGGGRDDGAKGGWWDVGCRCERFGGGGASAFAQKVAVVIRVCAISARGRVISVVVFVRRVVGVCRFWLRLPACYGKMRILRGQRFCIFVGRGRAKVEGEIGRYFVQNEGLCLGAVNQCQSFRPLLGACVEVIFAISLPLKRKVVFLARVRGPADDFLFGWG